MAFKINSQWFSNVLCIFYFTIPLWRATVFHILPAGGAFLVLCLLILIACSILIEPHGLLRYVDVYVFFLVLGALLGGALFLNPSVREWLTREYGVSLVLFQGSIFVYPVLRLQKSPEILIRNMKYAAIILGLYYAYMALEPLKKGYWTYVQFGVTKQSYANMSWSYGVLLVILIFCVCAIYEKKWILLLPVPVGLLLILQYGSRGSVISFIIAAVLYILIGKKNQLDWKKIVLILMLTLLILFVISNPGIELIKSLVHGTGIKSRFVDTFLNTIEGKKTIEDESNGRERIWKHVIRMIQEQPMGYGPMGHRTSIYKIGIKWGYSHNLFLDWLAEYGVILGFMMILGLSFIIIRLFNRITELSERLILILIIGVSCEMLFSAYYWLHIGIWSLLALYMNHFGPGWKKSPRDQLLLQIKTRMQV